MIYALLAVIVAGHQIASLLAVRDTRKHILDSALVWIAVLQTCDATTAPLLIDTPAADCIHCPLVSACDRWLA